MTLTHSEAADLAAHIGSLAKITSGTFEEIKAQLLRRRNIIFVSETNEVSALGRV
jgi:hypothetical protein